MSFVAATFVKFHMIYDNVNKTRIFDYVLLLIDEILFFFFSVGNITNYAKALRRLDSTVASSQCVLCPVSVLSNSVKSYIKHFMLKICHYSSQRV